ncbi:MAG TPA: hypothetical protein VIY56_05915 [Vicinamibacterales bacterium]
MFCTRVVAQPAALVLDTRLIPRFDAWYSGAIPYPQLLAAQVAILAWLAWTARAVQTRRVRPSRRLGAWLLAFAGVYAAVMVARLGLGLTVFRDVTWFARPVPTVFHLVLAGYLAVYGHLHFRHG